MHANKRRRLAVDNHGVLPLDLLEAVLTQADVETKRACALASRALREPLMTGCCWPQEVRLDLHDSRQLRWLQQHITVVERLGICLEYSLIGRFNRLLRHRGAPHLTSLSIQMTPDYMEETRMHVFELRGLRLLDLNLHHGGRTPVISTHHLPTTLRSLTLADVQLSDKQVFFGGQGVQQCLALGKEIVAWSFARQLPASVTRLRLMCTKEHLLDGLETLKQCCNLEELDIDVTSHGPEFENPAGSESDVEKENGCGAVALAGALARLHLKRVGLHASTGCECVCLHNPHIAQMHRTFYFAECDRVSVEDQIGHGTRHCVLRLTLHPYCTPMWPSFSLFPALKELVIGDTFEAFGHAYGDPFLLKGLEVVATTLRHLTMSSSRAETCIELPQGLRLHSFVCVCVAAPFSCTVMHTPWARA